MPGTVSIVDLPSLQKKLSINVPLYVENIVGRVILGKKLCDITVSKKSLKASFSSRPYL